MKTILYGALALGALGSLAAAKNEAKSTWLGLDEELHALSSNLNLQGDGPRFGGIVKGVFTHSEDAAFGAGPDDDVSGFSLYNARLFAEGDFGDIGWRVSFDFGDEVLGAGDVVEVTTTGEADPDGVPASGDEFDVTTTGNVFFAADRPALLDAYGTWTIAEAFTITWGQFMFPTLMSNTESPDELLFINRSRIGQAFYDWDLGVMFGGDYDALRWYAAIQNGADNVGDEYRFSGRVEFDLGEGQRNGATRSAASRDLDATIGVFGLVDDNGGEGTAAEDVTAFGADARLGVGAFTIGAEIVSVDDGGLGIVPTAPGFFLGTGFDDNTPWAAYAAYQIVPEEWEVGVRWEDLDDTDDTTILTVGVNWYPSAAPAMWQLNFVTIDSENDAFDGDAIQLGLTVGLNT